VKENEDKMNALSIKWMHYHTFLYVRTLHDRVQEWKYACKCIVPKCTYACLIKVLLPTDA